LTSRRSYRSSTPPPARYRQPFWPRFWITAIPFQARYCIAVAKGSANVVPVGWVGGLAGWSSCRYCHRAKLACGHQMRCPGNTRGGLRMGTGTGAGASCRRRGVVTARSRRWDTSELVGLQTKTLDFFFQNGTGRGFRRINWFTFFP